MDFWSFSIEIMYKLESYDGANPSDCLFLQSHLNESLLSDAI